MIYREDKEIIRERVFQYYRDMGYSVEEDFPNKYRFFFKPETGEKAKVYYRWSKVE